MNIPTTDIIQYLFKVVNDSQIQVYQTLWDSLILFLSSNWLLVTGLLLFFLAVSFVKAINGRWGMFGSIAYNYLYWGILFIAGLIFGPKIFASMLINILLFILYIICYRLVGKILDSLHLK